MYIVSGNIHFLHPNGKTIFHSLVQTIFLKTIDKINSTLTFDAQPPTNQTISSNKKVLTAFPNYKVILHTF